MFEGELVVKNRGEVAIIGGSMAGLFTAIALKSRGFKVHIFERSTGALTNGGAGIATHDQLYDALRTAGIELREEMGVPSKGRLMLNQKGQITHTRDMAQIMTSWGLIYRFLRAQIDEDNYHSDHNLISIKSNSNSITATFSNGHSVEADWLIGADGSQSQVRKIAAPDVNPIYAGYLGWRGLIDERLISPKILEQIALQVTFGMAPGGHWLGYLVAGPNDELTSGDRWYNWGWYRTADSEELRDYLTDESGKYCEGGIPRHLIREELINKMRKESTDHLAPQIQKIIAATRAPFLQPMYDFFSERLIFDRAILVGDAAFTARPHVGMGVSKAADDGASLAHALGSSENSALHEWEKERLKYGAAVVNWGRDLGSYLGPQSEDPDAQAKAAHYLTPEVLLSVTAASDPSQYL
jgi:2-polyprenyl-6-methoxyphenol hydroxylase-like FAD-dependent oxidoreductase